MDQPTLFPENLPTGEKPNSPLPLEAAINGLDTLTSDEIRSVASELEAKIKKIESLLRGYDRLYDDVNGGTTEDIQEYLKSIGGIEVISQARSDLAKFKVYRERVRTSLQTSAVIE
jgi:hypothetical protein